MREARLVAATQDGEPGDGEEEGTDDADGEQRGAGGLGRGGGVVGVLVGSVGVVADGEEGALGDGFIGGELASVDLVVYEVVVGDAEVFTGGKAECERAASADVVATGSDGGEGFGPCSLVGDGFGGHSVFNSEDEMR